MLVISWNDRGRVRDFKSQTYVLINSLCSPSGARVRAGKMKKSKQVSWMSNVTVQQRQGPRVSSTQSSKRHANFETDIFFTPRGDSMKGELGERIYTCDVSYHHMYRCLEG